jgi:protein phosphatase
VHSFSLGDSRIYFYREGIIAQITDDHTLANKKLKANLFTREEAENSPESHVLTKYLGMNCEENELFAERYRPFRLNPGEKLIICSDGLYDMCTNDEICDTLNVRKGGAEELVILA